MRPAIALLVLLLAAGPARALPTETEGWLSLTWDRYTIVSQVDETETRRVLAGLATFDRVLPQLEPALAVRSKQPIHVLVFRNTRSFSTYAPRKTESKDSEAIGFFLPGPGIDFAMINLGSPGHGYWGLYHEIVHAAVSRNFSSFPQWLNEGLADYYGSLTVDGANVRVGRASSGWRRYLADHPPLALRRVFNATETSPEYTDPAVRPGFYATSWALVHMLASGSPERRAMLDDLVRRLAAGESPTKAGLAVFGASYETLEADLAAYIRAANYATRATVIAGLPLEVAGAIRPVGRAELLVALGALLTQQGPDRAAEADSHFQNALALAPQDPQAHAGLAGLRLRQEQFAEAGTLFDRAIELGASDAQVFFGAARALLARAAAPGPGAPAGTPEQAASRARALLTRGLALAPESPDALADLGHTYLLDAGASAEGIATLERARAALPARADVALDLFRLSLRAGNRARAAELLAGPLAVLSPAAVLEAARGELSRFDQQQADELLRSGDVEGALARYRSLLADAPPAEREAIAERIATLEAGAGRRAEYARYNRAVELANAGQLASALAELAPLEQACSDPELASKVEEAARDLRATIDHNREIEAYNGAVKLAREGELARARAAFQQLSRSCKDPEVCRSAREALTQLGP